MDTLYIMPSTGKVYKTSRGVNNEIERSKHGRQVISVNVNTKSGKISSKNNIYGRKSKK